MSSKQIEDAINSIRNSRKILRELDVIRHEKPFHSELAEWLIEQYLGGERADSANQKSWDIQLSDGSKIQVKAHAKAPTNPSSWTTLPDELDGVSEIFIIIFNYDYYISEVFRVDVNTALSLCNAKRKITWSKLRNAKKSIELNELKKVHPYLFE